MLNIANSIDRLMKVKWIIPDESKVKDLEALLNVEFEKSNEKYYLIKNINYTALDVIFGLDELDFAVVKRGEEITVKILC